MDNIKYSWECSHCGVFEYETSYREAKKAAYAHRHPNVRIHSRCSDNPKYNFDLDLV